VKVIAPFVAAVMVRHGLIGLKTYGVIDDDILMQIIALTEQGKADLHTRVMEIE